MEKVLFPREFLRDPRFRGLSLVNKAAFNYIWLDAEPHGLWIVSPDMVEAYLGCKWDADFCLKQLDGIAHAFDEGRRWALPLWVEANHKDLKGEANQKVSTRQKWERYGILDFLPSSLLSKNLRSKGVPATIAGKGKGKEEGKGKGEEHEKGEPDDSNTQTAVWDDDGLKAMAQLRLGYSATPEKIKPLLSLVDIEHHGQLRKVITQLYQDSGPAFEKAIEEHFKNSNQLEALYETMPRENS